MSPLAFAQILIERKGTDPSAVTAREAIRDLLRLGPRLAELRRRRLLELVLPADAPSPAEALGRYLHHTVLLWNSNKERAWFRLDGSKGQSSFLIAGAEQRAAPFGHPSLDEAEFDHLLVWARDGDAAPLDLETGLAPLRVLAVGGAELWSARWSAETSAEERGEFLATIGEARTRLQGFLVNPHYQDHRVIRGAVPCPLWSGGPLGAESPSGGSR